MRRLPSSIRGRIRCSLVQRTGPGLVDWIPVPAVKHEEAVMMRFLVLALLLVPQGMLHAQSRNLDIYWIDVEGGAATLIVSPSGESMLIDTGWEVDGRDAKRIRAAAEQAGLKKIDHIIISHYHADHVGGLAALSKMIPIGAVYGRGHGI